MFMIVIVIMPLTVTLLLMTLLLIVTLLLMTLLMIVILLMTLLLIVIMIVIFSEGRYRKRQSTCYRADEREFAKHLVYCD